MEFYEQFKFGKNTDLIKIVESRKGTRQKPEPFCSCYKARKVENGNPDMAYKLYKSAFDTTDDSECLNDFGFFLDTAYVRKADEKEAINAFEKGLQMEPWSAAISFNYAFHYR
eukprot:UN00531